MVSQVYVHPKVEKMLEQMETRENAPSIAAKRALSIIQSIVKGNTLPQAGCLSKKKDARIKNLIKFNLGSGYRLVCIEEKSCLHVLFIGSHDHCDAWLNRNSSKSPHKTGIPMTVYYVDSTDTTNPGISEVADKIEYDDFLISEISQKDLKKVFSGLVGNP